MSNGTDRNSEDRLADTYRALAEERAPDYLNEKVLRLAAGNRSRYSRARAWMRPAAWAAVIGLSLAIVLEMTRLPQPEPDSIGISIPDARKAADQGPKAHATADDHRAAEAEATAPPSAARIEQSSDARIVQPESSGTGGTERPLNEDFVPKDMTVLRDAEEMARTRAGSDQGLILPGAVRDETAVSGDLKEEIETGVRGKRAVVTENVRADGGQREGTAAAAPFATLATTEPPASARFCAESVREEAESWIACIRELEESGQAAEARDEYEEFRRVFPDFDAQDSDK